MSVTDSHESGELRHVDVSFGTAPHLPIGSR